LLRQRDGGELFQHAQERTGARARLSVARGRASGDLRVHRDLLQSATDSSEPEVRQSRAVRVRQPVSFLGVHETRGSSASWDTTLALLPTRTPTGSLLAMC